MATTSPSLSSVLQGTARPESAKKWFERLVWAQLTVEGIDCNAKTKLWWPALRFESVAEFDHENEEEAAGNYDYRIDLAVCLMEKMQADNGPVQVVRFLGRPLADVQPVHEDEVLDFIGHLNTRQEIFNPDHFLTQLVLEAARSFYEAFHRGMDEFAKILYQLRPRPHNFEPWISKAQRIWEHRKASVRAGTLVDSSSQQPACRQVQSPNHSIAAISVAEESQVSTSYRHHHAANTPASTMTTSLTRISPGQRTFKTGTKLDYGKIPKIDPLGMITWKEARVQLTCAGWTKVKNSGEELYQPYHKGPQLKLGEVQQICQQIYGWKPLAGLDTQSPPSQMIIREDNVPESNAKNYSFGFLWKHKCKPDGWLRVRPPRGAAAFVDYYYLRPGITRQNLGVKNQDYFEDHYAVLDWCRRHNYYPTVDWNSGDETSVATEIAGDPSTYLEEIENKKGSCRNSAEKKSKPKRSPRNYSFGVLWASYLEPNGWTMPKAKRNALTDYYYVRPGRTVQGGKLNIDYFASTDAVLDYCAKHNDYPESSGASSCSPDDGTIATAADASTFANDESSDDESTKLPGETDDEGKKPVMEDDDHTIGEFSTPGTKTQPQDPGKPLLRDDDKTPELDEEQTYHWKNLWPILEKQRGWGCIKAKNEFDDWWYLLPRKLRLDGVQSEMVKGVDYFTNQNDVIDYCKRVDREDAMIRLKTKGIFSKHSCQNNFQKAGPNHKIPRRKSHQEKVKAKRAKTREVRTVADICVLVDSNKNSETPWVKSPLPKNLHNLVTAVGGIKYSGSHYYLHNESNKKYSFRFQDIPDLLKHLCHLGRGNYYVNTEAEQKDVKLYKRLIDHAFVPGSPFEHRKIRPLNRDEIILCLKELFQFTQTNDKWDVPEFLQRNGEAVPPDNPAKLKSSYTCLSELLRALRCIQHLEGNEVGRRRKPMDKKNQFEQHDNLNMAFRLTIAEDRIIDALKGEEDDFQVSKRRLGTTQDVGPDGMDVDNYSHSKPVGPKIAKVGSTVRSDGQLSAKGRKRGSPPSSSKKCAKKIKPGNKFEIEDLKVRWKGDAQENPAPWVSVTCPDFSTAKLIGVSYQGGHYYLPEESAVNHSTRFTSIDEVFAHFCTYGNYSLKHLKKEARSELKWQIALGNVPGLPSSWNKYRMLENSDALAILGLLGFKEQSDKTWLVPDLLLQETNPFQNGHPPLIKSKYSSLDELRVALRKMPELEMSSGGRLRRRDGKLTEHQTVAFRLWLASGPEGPDDTTTPQAIFDETMHDSAMAGVADRQLGKPMSPAGTLTSSDHGGDFEAVVDTDHDSSDNMKGLKTQHIEERRDVAGAPRRDKPEELKDDADNTEQTRWQVDEALAPADSSLIEGGASDEETSCATTNNSTRIQFLRKKDSSTPPTEKSHDELARTTDGKENDVTSPCPMIADEEMSCPDFAEPATTADPKKTTISSCMYISTTDHHGLMVEEIAHGSPGPIGTDAVMPCPTDTETINASTNQFDDNVSTADRTCSIVEEISPSLCPFEGDDEMIVPDFGKPIDDDRNHQAQVESPAIYERTLLTQPAVGLSMSQDSEDDENATFINFGNSGENYLSPIRRNLEEDHGKVYSVEKGDWGEQFQARWLTQSYDE